MVSLLGVTRRADNIDTAVALSLDTATATESESESESEAESECERLCVCASADRGYVVRRTGHRKGIELESGEIEIASDLLFFYFDVHRWLLGPAGLWGKCYPKKLSM